MLKQRPSGEKGRARLPLFLCALAWYAYVSGFGHEQQADSSTHARLAALLQQADVSLNQLTDMVWAAYTLPAEPSDTGAWRATPIDAAANDIVPVVVYKHQVSGEAIVGFPGLSLQPADASKGIPEYVNGAQACVAGVMFEDSAAAEPYRRLCDAGGQQHQPLPTVAAQTDRLLDAVGGPVALLTAHSIGCEIALSVGRVRRIPVICFGAAGSFPAAWVAGWPGLADACS